MEIRGERLTGMPIILISSLDVILAARIEDELQLERRMEWRLKKGKTNKDGALMDEERCPCDERDGGSREKINPRRELG
jgi:hypothetical protein